MYKIESANWEEVKSLWNEYHVYDLINPVPTVKIDPLNKTWIDLSDILAFKGLKTLVFKKDEEIMGMMQVVDIINGHYPALNIAGIQNVAVKAELRNNGIGRKLMEAADFYLKEHKYDLSMLYSSLYASRINFYEKFGYIRHEQEFDFGASIGIRKIHLKHYNNTDLTVNELNEIIRETGKF